MSEFTHVELTWREKRIQNWIGFGRTADEHIIDDHRRVVSFAVGSIWPNWRLCPRGPPASILGSTFSSA
jgi:hypothetical protein